MRSMRIVFAGENQAGLIGFLTVKALGHDIIAVVTRTREIAELAVPESLLWGSIHQVKDLLTAIDVIVNVHGREILTQEELDIPLYGCINVHPCLWKYPGSRPIKRLLDDGGTTASVAAHIMTEKIDSGPVLVEKLVNIDGLKTEVEVYNQLYYLYPQILLQAISMIKGRYLCP